MAMHRLQSAESLSEPPPDDAATDLAAQLEMAVRFARGFALKQEDVEWERAGDIAQTAVAMIWKNRGKPGGYDPTRPFEP